MQTTLISVPENLGANKVVGHVFATDLDSGSFGQVRYSISHHNKPKVKNLFQIDSKTGVITLKKSLDREAGDDRYIYVRLVNLRKFPV